VSFGMLAERGGAGAVQVSDPYRACILGEALTIGTDVKEPLQVLERGDEDKDWHVSALPEFEKFLALYRKSFGRAVPLDAKMRAALIGAVDNSVADLRHVLQEERNRPGRLARAEPIFIAPLRELIVMLNRSGNAIN
jgi:hypothetical protein